MRGFPRTVPRGSARARKRLIGCKRRSTLSLFRCLCRCFKDDFQIWPMDFFKRLIDDTGVVFVQPVAELSVWNENPDRVIGLVNETSWPKPSIKAVVIDLGLNFVKNFFPEIHSVSTFYQKPFSSEDLSEIKISTKH